LLLAYKALYIGFDHEVYSYSSSYLNLFPL
jgi:hypothetical protein